MDREKLRLVVVHAIESRTSEGSRDPSDFDVDAIVEELDTLAPEGTVPELDGADCWRIIAKHER